MLTGMCAKVCKRNRYGNNDLGMWKIWKTSIPLL